MTARPLVTRRRADEDIQAALSYYAREAGERVAERFVDAIEVAFASIRRQPGAGSPRYAHELHLPGLRSRMLRGFPYMIFYVEAVDRIEVWRVLHAHRDIPQYMREL